MIVLHHLENSRSQRVLWLLEELGLDYRVQRYARDPKTMLAPPELRQVHPLGKSPVIEDAGQVVAESGLIAEYLVERHGQASGLMPAIGTPANLRCRYWLHYAEGSAMPPLLLSLVFSKVRSAPAPFFVRPIARAIADRVRSSFIGPQLRLHTDYMEQALADTGWFAGPEFSVADIQMSFPIEALAARSGLDAQPNLRDWLARVQARPAYQRALAAGGPYTILD